MVWVVDFILLHRLLYRRLHAYLLYHLWLLHDLLLSWLWRLLTSFVPARPRVGNIFLQSERLPWFLVRLSFLGNRLGSLDISPVFHHPVVFIFQISLRLRILDARKHLLILLYLALLLNLLQLFFSVGEAIGRAFAFHVFLPIVCETVVHHRSCIWLFFTLRNNTFFGRQLGRVRWFAKRWLCGFGISYSCELFLTN